MLEGVLKCVRGCVEGAGAQGKVMDQVHLIVVDIRCVCVGCKRDVRGVSYVC